MAAKIIAFACFQFVMFNSLNAQCLNRIMPGCGPNLLPMPLPVAETLIPNQMMYNPNYGPPIMEVPYGVETIVSKPMSLPATTIIQDSTVANNLANALQLLVVSNLLSNTLSSPGEVIVPGLSGLPGYGSSLDYGVMPIGPVASPISSCGYSPYNYLY